jgi:hypothetical protein
VSASDDKTVKIWDVATGTLQQTIAVDNYVSTLSFDVRTSILILPLSISSQEVGSKSNYEGLGISGSWVTWNNQNLLWLPPGFRAWTSNISYTGSTLAIGCISGKVIIIRVSLNILHSYYS